MSDTHHHSRPGHAEGEGFTRVLGRFDVLAVAFGAMIGFGWIVLTGTFIESAGSLGSALAFVAGGVVILLVALTYAELVSAMPHVGGEHNYVLRAMGSRPAFFTSWMLVLGYVSVVAFEAVALPQTLLYLFPDMLIGKLWTVAGYDVYASWMAVGILASVGITALNVRGVRPTAVFQTVAVAFLLVVGAMLLTGSFVGGDSRNLEPLFTGGVSGFLAVLVATPFLFVGFDVIPQSAEEINLESRKIGQVLLLSVFMAVAWYVMVMLTVSSALPASVLAQSDLAAADGMSQLWGSPIFGQILVLGGIAGILTSWNGFLIGASRLIYAMARSGMLPSWFAKLHPTYKTPVNAIIFVGGLATLSPFFGRPALVWLVDAGGLAIIVAFLMVSLSFVVLRAKEPDMPRPFTTPGGMVTGVLAVVLAASLAILFMPGMSAALVWPQEWAIVLAWAVLGAVFMARLPKVTPGKDAEHELMVKTGRLPG
ncbi:MAG: APC family permease [Actinomycetales bacterium]